jgi:AraC-like DNA-binding protein
MYSYSILFRYSIAFIAVFRYNLKQSMGLYESRAYSIFAMGKVKAEMLKNEIQNSVIRRSGTTSSKGRERLQLDFSTLGFKGQLSLGRYKYCRAHPPLHMHHHTGCMEICYLFSGTQVYEVGGRKYVLTGNDVYLTFPDEKHGTGGFPEDRGILYWMLLRMPGVDEPFLAFSSGKAGPLIDHLCRLEQRSFRGTGALHDLLEEIIVLASPDGSLMSEGRSPTNMPEPLKPLAASTKVMEFLLEVLRCADLQMETYQSNDIRSVLNYIEENIDRSIAINELAAVAGLSVSRIKAKFKQVVGIPPAEYILRCKVDLARKMLSGSREPVTSIAYSLGFSSSQYFSTVFKRFTNQRPGEYRQRHFQSARNFNLCATNG